MTNVHLVDVPPVEKGGLLVVLDVLMKMVISSLSSMFFHARIERVCRYCSSPRGSSRDSNAVSERAEQWSFASTG